MKSAEGYTLIAGDYMRKLLLLIILILNECDDMNRNYHFNDYIKDNIFLICTDGFPSRTESANTWKDQGDGSIRVLTKVKIIHPCFGGEYTTETFYKKCLQGQVFRPSQNDCKGTGTAPYWGAMLFQFCPSNDTACEKPKFNGDSWGNPNPVISPAEHSCSVDSTGGKSWAMIDSYYLNKEYVQMAPDIPTGISDFIWRGGLDLMQGDTSERTVFRFLEFGSTAYINGSDSFLKNTFHYVLCSVPEHRL